MLAVGPCVSVSREAVREGRALLLVHCQFHMRLVEFSA